MDTKTKSESRALLRCAELRVGYGGKDLLPPIDASFGVGEFWAVIGRNGAGKSTWFKTLLGLLPPVGGRIERPSGPVRLSYIAQRSTFDELYPLRARDVVAMGALRGRDVFGWRVLFEPPIVEEALSAIGIAHLGDRAFRTLSEGQKQRVLLARLVASRAELALLDEPTAAMDIVADREAFELLASLKNRYGMTIVVVSHYLGVARDFADHAILLDRDRGRDSVVVGAPDDVFEHEVFRRRYGDPAEVCRHG